MSAQRSVIDRFLAPAHAALDIDISGWHGEHVQSTPGADAWCRMLVQRDDAHSYTARFLAFGPPGVIAAADWLCEQVEQHGLETTLALTAADVERALGLAADERYIGLLVIDALTATGAHLGR